MLTLIIPKPPSVNAATRNAGPKDRKRGRIKSKAYSAWLVAAGPILARARPARPLGHYGLEIELGRRAGSDLGNYEKCLSDALKRFGFIRDDSDCERLLITWADDLASKQCRFTITPAQRSRANVR